MTPLDAARVATSLGARGTGLGHPLSVVAETGSTNDDAAAAARAGAPHGATFVAETQTAGRGRRGHRWHTPPGDSLAFSLILRPTLAPSDASALTLAIGLAVRDVVARRVPEAAAVKWPNDVLVDEKKIAGILVESQIVGARVAAVIVGVGLNVLTRAFPPEIAATATSLALAGARDLDREALLAELLGEIETRTAAFAQSGLSSMLEELKRHDALASKSVRVGSVEGVADGIAPDGALRIRDANGNVIEVRSGEVERL